MTSPREHVEEIRRKKFSIGGEENALTEDLHQAVKNLSAELYAKDVHFLMELIQNAEDNEYSERVDPSLEFIITSKDITATGAPATLLIFNNEIGFSPKNIESICSVGRSTKKGNRKKGYIGEKGIGFKSVFLITARPYIFSNGYQIRFNEEPCQHCNVGYIVPEWVDQNPNLSELTQLYGSGSGSSLPTTILILPLKPDKIEPVKRQLLAIHPQVLLFLSKIKRLSVRAHCDSEDSGEDSGVDTVSGIAITKETDFKQSKSIDAESFTLHLCADEDGSGRECSYYMWKQKFPVPSGFRVERRSDIDEWVITLAFPNGDSLGRGDSSPGIYAFLPTEMVTNFPFIVQADFLLASSRETILLDEKWDSYIILRCVSQAFVCAFKALVEANRDAPAWILPDIFRFLPVEESNYRELNEVREAIKEKLAGEEVVPSEVVARQKFFHKPREVGRLMPCFWKILEKARGENVKLPGLSSHGRYVLSSYFDREEYDRVLDFLQVRLVNDEWYVKCLLGSNLAEKVSEDVYLEILSFVAENWESKFHCTGIKNIPLVKYEDSNGTVSLLSMSQNSSGSVHLSRRLDQAPWLIDWNDEFAPVSKLLFVPFTTQQAIDSSPKKEILLQWLREQAKLGCINVNEFASLVSKSLDRDRRLAVAYAHFLFHSVSNKFLRKKQVDRLCDAMPIVDCYGKISAQRNGVLVPATGSKWAELVLSNLWKKDGYVELSEDYLTPFHVGGELVTPENGLLGFLEEHGKAEDVPRIPLPNCPIPSVSSPLTKENAFLLLEWVQNQKSNRGLRVPGKFLASVREGSWLRVTLNGCPGSRPPRESFLLGTSNSWGSLLQNNLVLVDIPLVDQCFYGEEIESYREALREVGVMSEYSEACRFIGKQLMAIASSGALTRSNVLSILKFIEFLRVNLLSPEDFITSVKKGKWIRTSSGEKSPGESVLFDEEKWKTASKISNIPFIDQDYYGDEIRKHEKELELLGVVVGFSKEIVVDNLKPSSSLASLSAEALLLALQCVGCNSSDKIAKALRDTKCLKTKFGYKKPGETILCDPEWGCLFQVFDALPLIDPAFYGESITSYRTELKLFGVMVDFDLAAKAFVRCFNERASSKSISKDNAISLLKCYRQLKESSTHKFPSDLKKCFEAKWLRTRHCDYYRSPKECVLYSPEWKPISPIARLPFADDSDNWYGNEIHEYKKELKNMGVVVNFKDGAKFVVDGLYFHDVESVTRENALSLLECVRVLREEKSYEFPEEFSKKISQAWLKTKAGYKSPGKCLLFDSKFSEYLKETDGPFIDEEFYGPKLSSYREVLSSIGVTVDLEKGCSLIASQLDSHSEFSTILRLYNYLSKFNWKPESELDKKIWIPHGNREGQWASPEDCVVSDKSELFRSQMIILDKYYKKDLFFFSNAFNVKLSPCIEDYCKLWKSWEISSRVLSHEECCKFWTYIANHWTSKTEKTVSDELSKVPVKLSSNGIVLRNKIDVFIADDLQLKDLFDKSCTSRSVFVWYPQPSSPTLSRTKLLQVFQNIGVRTISESVQREEVSILNNGNEQDQKVVPNDALIGKGLVKLILGFLANPSIGMEAKERHKAIEALLKLTVIETVEPIDVRYNLSLSSGEILKVTASRTVRWERESSKIFTQKMDGSKGPRDLIERATYFAEVIAEGVLWQNGDHIHDLTELLKVAFMLNFEEEAIEFLMKSKNSQIFVEDETFLMCSVGRQAGRESTSMDAAAQTRHEMASVQRTWRAKRGRGAFRLR